MKKQSTKKIFLMCKAEILNTFLAVWISIMPWIEQGDNINDDKGGSVWLLMMYTPLVLLSYVAFLKIFRNFSKKKEKLAINMSFILDILFIFVYMIFDVEPADRASWLIISNTIILLLHILGIIKIIKQLKETSELQGSEADDKNVLLDSLIKFMPPNVLIGAPLAIIMLLGGYKDILIASYAFLRLIVIITGLLAVITTIKEKESLATFNIIFATINIIFTFNHVEIFLGMDHLKTVNNYLDENEEEELE